MSLRLASAIHTAQVMKMDLGTQRMSRRHRDPQSLYQLSLFAPLRSSV